MIRYVWVVERVGKKIGDGKFFLKGKGRPAGGGGGVRLLLAAGRLASLGWPGSPARWSGTTVHRCVCCSWHLGHNRSFQRTISPEPLPLYLRRARLENPGSVARRVEWLR
jgi:hypothetical protein